jgi:hypothetical protein
VRDDGYIDIYEPSHPIARNDGYVFEHRKLMWDAGLLTDPELEVHHKSHIRSDNRFDNLEVKDGAQHALDHTEERGWVRNQHGKWPVKPRERRISAPRPIRPCGFCRETIPLTKRRDARYCSIPCQQAAFKQRNPRTGSHDRLTLAELVTTPEQRADRYEDQSPLVRDRLPTSSG